MKILIAYFSYSGNTEEVAQLIEKKVQQEGISVDKYEIGFGIMPNIEAYDIVFLGTFTWDYGSTPSEVKDFIADIGYKPERMAIFGSGDTQFGGEELFCQAVEKLVRFYASKWDGLKVEQSPRGSQEQIVNEWIKGVLQDVAVTA